MKKLILFLTVLLVAMLALASCAQPPSTEPPEDNPKFEGTPVYQKDVTARIITPADAGMSINVTAIASKLVQLTGKMPNTFNDGSEPAASEIVIGKTARVVSALAEDYIDEMDDVDLDTAAWCIYAYGGSVGIVWTHDDIPPLVDEAMNTFLNDYVKEDHLVLKDGVVKYQTYDRRAYEDAREAAIRERQLTEIEALLGKDARDAIEDYLKIFTPKYYEWLANLYDPGTGGFYYSNSGRDNEGFLPDIESTVQALNWIGSNGMLEKYGNDISKAIPDWMQKQVLEFAMGLQSPIDGYFYHPQWGTNVSTSRISRDLGWATQIIKKFGGQVLYDAPNGDKGSMGPPPGVAPTSAMTTPLGASVATAVSKVVATSTTHLPPHLQSPVAFRNYLNSFDYAESSYPAGNTITSQNSQILNAGPEYVAVFEEVLNAKQEEAQEKLRDKAEAELKNINPNATADEIAAARKAAENGLWEDRVSFDSVNGLMKISSAYNGLKVKMPYIEAALKSAIQMVYHEGADVEGKSPTNSVDVYNPWVSITALINNAKNYYSKAESDALRALLIDNAADMIRVTMKKVSIFEKSDGSYGYTNKNSPARSQGAPVAMEGTVEGDINGGNIATNGTFGNMCSALGISKPNMYFNSDWERFIEIIENLGPVEKQEIVLETTPVNFDDDAVGDEPSRISASMNGGYVQIVKDNREGATGNVMEFSTVTGTGQTVTTPIIGSGKGNCFVLEWDMNIKSSKKNTCIFQIRLGESYMFTVHTQTNSYTIGDSSSTTATASVTNSFSGTYNYDTWYTFRIEYYCGDIDTVKTLIYVNDQLVGESNNFFGKVREGVTPVATPKSDYMVARFYALYSADIVVHFDNIRAEKINKTLEAAK